MIIDKKKMTYMEFIRAYISDVEIGQPIYSVDIARDLATQYGITDGKARRIVANVIKQIMDREIQPNLRFFHRGIYYLTSVTPFGEVGINTEQLISDKYLKQDQGYEGALTFLYCIGLTTQIPRSREVITNKAKNRARYDKHLDVMIRPPKTPITAENKLYLQLLDVLERLDTAPIDNEQPYQTIVAYIQERNLQYETLLALADRHYTKECLLHLLQIADVMRLAQALEGEASEFLD